MEITKPETSAKFIRIPVASPQKSDQIRTITISAKEGISALYAYNRKIILTYLFSRAKGWDMAKAQAWIKSHKTGKSLNNLTDKAMEQTNRFKFVLPIIKTRVEIVKDEAGNQVEEHYIVGKASSTDKDLVGDRMDPSAIKTMAESIKQHVINLNAEHDTSWLFEMGDVTTLSVTDDSDLLFESKLNKMSASKDLWYAVTELHKKLGVSIGGYVKAYEWEEEADTGEMLRVFKDIELDHIAIVSQPANPKTWIEAIQKSLPITDKTKQDELLTNAGKEDSDETKTNLIFNKKHMTKKENSLEAEKKVSAAPEDEKKTEKSKIEPEKTKLEKKKSLDEDEKLPDEEGEGTKEDEKPVDEKEEKAEEKQDKKEETDVEEKVEVKSKTPDKKEMVEKKEEKVEEKKEEKKVEEGKADELIEKAVSKLAESLEKKFASITEGIESLTKRVESMEDMPAERKGVDISKGVGNENDGKSANGEDAKTLMEKELKATETQFVNNADKQFIEKARIRRFYKDNYGIE